MCAAETFTECGCPFERFKFVFKRDDACTETEAFLNDAFIKGESLVKDGVGRESPDLRRIGADGVDPADFEFAVGIKSGFCQNRRGTAPVLDAFLDFGFIIFCALLRIPSDIRRVRLTVAPDGELKHDPFVCFEFLPDLFRGEL